MLFCHNISQVNIVVYLGDRLKSNLKNIEGDKKKTKKNIFLAPKSLPHFSV